MCWELYKVAIPGGLRMNQIYIASLGYTATVQIGQLLMKIQLLLDSFKLACDEFRPWETLRVLSEILFRY